jgi:hypothetical protein
VTANTVYEVFKALSPEERQKLIVLVTENQNTTRNKAPRTKKAKIEFTKQDAIDYLLATVFKPKN